MRLRALVLPVVFAFLIGSGRPIGYSPPKEEAGGGGGYSADITEDWDCADSSGSIDCDLGWTENNTGNAEIESNKVITAVGNGDPVWVYNDQTLGDDDHCVQADLELNGSGTSRIIADVFLRHDGTSTQTYYQARIRDDTANSDHIEIQEITAGSSASLASDTYTLTPGTAYTVRFCAEGSNLEMFIDGVSELTATDSTLTGRFVTGFQIRNNTGSVSTEIDNFEAGTIK